MLKVKPYIFLLFFVLPLSLLAQRSYNRYDFERSQIILNPASSGNFDGLIRMTSFYKQRTICENSVIFRSPVVFLDFHLKNKFRKQDWFGLGSSINYNEENISYLSDHQKYFSLAKKIYAGYFSYHYSLDKKRNNVISLGIQLGIFRSFINSIALITPISIEEFLNNNNHDTLYLNIKDFNFSSPSLFNKSIFGYSFGIDYFKNISDISNFEIALSISNLHSDLNFLLSKNNKNFNKINAAIISNYKTKLSNGIFIQPELLLLYNNRIFSENFQFLIGKEFKNSFSYIISGGI